jgi:hypothetical protein
LKGWSAWRACPARHVAIRDCHQTGADPLQTGGFFIDAGSWISNACGDALPAGGQPPHKLITKTP